MFEAMKAYDELKAGGIVMRVIDLFSIQPIDRETLLASARAAGNNVIPVHKMGITEIPHSGKPQQLIEKFGISSNAIVLKVRGLLK